MPTPGNVISGGLDDVAQKIVEAIVPVVKQVGTLWVSTPTPQIATDPGSGKASSTVAFIQGSLWWYMAAALVLAVIIGGTRMAWEQRGEPLRDLLKALLTFVVVSSAGLSVIALGTAAGDAYAKWVIDTSTNGTDFAANIAKMLGFLAKSSAATPAPGNPVIFVIIAGFLALLFSCFQIVLMVVRGGMLVVLAGVFPLTAAFTNTETGRAWFRKTCGWILAFLLYKPAAAIIYATSFRLVGDAQFGSGGGITTALTGVTLMLLALVALPALMRFVVPMVSAVGGGSGGGAALGAAAMALPSGAISAGGRGTASGSGAAGARASGGQGSSGGGAGGGGKPASGSQLAGAGTRAGGSAAGASAGAGAGAAAGAGSAAAGAAGGPVGVAVTGAKQAGQAASSAVTAAATQSGGGLSSSSAGGAGSSPGGTSSGGTTAVGKPKPGGGSAGPAATGSDASGSTDAPSGGQAAGGRHSGPVGSASTNGHGGGKAGAGGWSARDAARGVTDAHRGAVRDVSDMTEGDEGPRGSG